MSHGMRRGPLDFRCTSLSLAVPSGTEADRLFNLLQHLLDGSPGFRPVRVRQQRAEPDRRAEHVTISVPLWATRHNALSNQLDYASTSLRILR